ncbi:MAG TPA: PQQ-binding-like beta-propeller repeat protein [Terriglobales bacterium]|nr:PQQ-binding-like beta-propeller repeat protein [Terriglobales bacterium]
MCARFKYAYSLQTHSRLERGGNIFDPRERPQPITFRACLFVACLLLCDLASAAPSITLSKKSGPPTSKILVSGRGFEPNVGVDIFFDTKDETLIVTNNEGEFQNAGVYAPRSAHPGQHWVTALERNNDKGAQEVFLVQTDWPQGRFDVSLTGTNPYENVLNARMVAGLSLKWRYPNGHRIFSCPAVRAGVVYIADWPDPGHETSNLYALEADDGSLLWSFVAYGFSPCPAVVTDIVYVGGGIYVYALNAHNGHIIWSFGTGNTITTSPTVSDGVVYVGSQDGNLYALDAYSGVLLWSNAIGPFVSSAAIANGVIYVGGGKNQGLYALDARSGNVLWSFAAQVGPSPAVADDIVYASAGNTTLYALNATTGAALWSYTVPSGLGESAPAFANGVVYIGTGYEPNVPGHVIALSASTGALLWDYEAGDRVNSSPVVADGVVYVGSEDNNIYALDANNGVLLWEYVTGGLVESSAAVSDGVVYIGSNDGNVYAFDLKPGEDKGEKDSKRPTFKTLRPDFNLKVSGRFETGNRQVPSNKLTKSGITRFDCCSMSAMAIYRHSRRLLTGRVAG